MRGGRGSEWVGYAPDRFDCDGGFTALSRICGSSCGGTILPNETLAAHLGFRQANCS